MPNQQPIITAVSGREFAGFAVAVQAIIINQKEEVLLLSSPTRNADGAWQVVSGALDAGESVLDGTLREVHEELGPAIKVRPLGTVHIKSFQYDDNVQFAIGIYYLLAYEGGQIVPGDDMVGSACKWWNVEDFIRNGYRLHVPRQEVWMLNRAVDLYRLWKDNAADISL